MPRGGFVLSVRIGLGVAWSSVSLLLTAGLVEGDKDTTTSTTTFPDHSNSSYFRDLTNGTTPKYNYEDDDSVLDSPAFRNGMLAAVSIAVTIAIYACKTYYRKKRRAQTEQAGAAENGTAAPPPPYQNDTSQPASSQTWNMTSSSPSSLSSGLPLSTTQLSPSFTSASGIDYSNNNFLSNYSTAANYSNIGRI